MELRRRGHFNWIAARPGEPLALAAEKEGLSVFPVRPWGEWDFWTAARLARFARKNGVSIFHAHTGHAVGLGALAVRGTSISLLATRRVNFPLGSGFFSRWKYRRLKALAVLSSAIYQKAVAGGIPASKIVVIPSGIDSAGYPHVHDRDSFRRKLGFSSEDLLIVTVGALDLQKDQATFLRAAALVAPAFPQAKFLLAGEGPLRRELEGLTRELKMSDRVFFLGHRPEVLEYTAMADVFVLASAEEGLGTALLDALIIGVPTVATAAGGIPDLYGGPHVPELCAPRDPGALARNIHYVLGDRDERSRRVICGHERSRLFTVLAMGDAYEKFYDIHQPFPVPLRPNV